MHSIRGPLSYPTNNGILSPSVRDGLKEERVGNGSNVEIRFSLRKQQSGQLDEEEEESRGAKRKPPLQGGKEERI